MQERQTKQKQMIYEALSALDHPTATEVYGYIRQTQPTVSRATVFRVLGGFVSNGRALELRSAGSEVRYDYRVEPHCHIRCVDCGCVADVTPTGADMSNVSLENDNGFLVEGYSVEFYGSCKSCRTSN